MNALSLLLSPLIVPLLCDAPPVVDAAAPLLSTPSAARFVAADPRSSARGPEPAAELVQDPEPSPAAASPPPERLPRRRWRDDQSGTDRMTSRAPGPLERAFRDPPLAARPMVLWPWLNGFVDRERMIYELRQMRAKGLRGPIIWDIGSLADPGKSIPVGPPFLGPESVATIHAALDEADRLGLEVGLVASSSWNAGGAWITPEHASKQLRWAELKVSGPSTLTAPVPAPKDLAPPFFEVALRALPADGGESIDVAGLVDGDGILSWEVPAGDWTILRFACSGTGQPLVCPSPQSDGLVVDHMSRAATDRHLDVMFERLYAGRDELPALKLMMLDSFEVWQRVDWTPDFAGEFVAAYGYDPSPYLPILAGYDVGTPELRARFLHDYRGLVSADMIENHFRRAATLLERRGLELLAEAGHGGAPRVDPLEGLGAAQIPMGEFWNGKQFWVTKEAASAAHIYGRPDVAAEALTGWRHWLDGPMEYRRLFDIAFCAGLTRPVFHTFAHNPAIAGRPGFAYHAGEHFNVNSTWWEQAGPLVEYLSRCCQMLRQGRFVADVCFYYGDEEPNLVPSRRIDPKVEPPHDAGECQHCGRPLPNRLDSLGSGYDYDYVNRDIVVRDMEVQDGRLTLSSGMEYRVLALPDREDIALPVLRKLVALVHDGAIVVGRRPTRANSLEGYPACDDEVRRLAGLLWGEGDEEAEGHAYGAGRVFADAPLRGVLDGLGQRPDFTVVTPREHQLDFIHRRTAREDIYLVVNGADQPVRAECAFRVPPDRSPSLWNAEDGSIAPCPVYRVDSGGTHVPLHLPEVSSVFVVFRAADDVDHVVGVGRADGAPGLVDPDVEVLALTPTHARIRADRASGTFRITTARGRSASFDVPTDEVADLLPSGGWRLEFPPGHGAPAVVELGALTSWTELADEGARFFAGTARYATTIDVPPALLDGRHALELDLGAVAEVAEVTINGLPVGVLWNAPYRADVTRALKPGANRVEVAVTNVWHNRIVGDLRAPDGGVHATTNLKSRFRADMALLPAGLLGPVRIHAVAEVDVPLR